MPTIKLKPKAPKAKKKPNPQDATLRNIRALKKRVGVLECILREGFGYRIP